MLDDLFKLVQVAKTNPNLRDLVSSEIVAKISDHGKGYPLLAFSLGSTEPTAPVLFITGGVHGLERIGAQLAWSLLKTTLDRLEWDLTLRHLFQYIRFVVIPLVNPSGYYHYTRSNGNGVDLMRNSPVVAAEKTPFLLGGQRFSKKLPWYQGQPGTLEIESKALVDHFMKTAQRSQCVVSVDFHSGFGMKDRLWFPFSYTSEPFDNLAELHALTRLFEQSHPYHIYQIEPQSKGYLLSGDLWDFLYMEFKKENSSGTFIPLTLEMGSWTWVRKNPLQIFSKHGVFNPVREHRIKRTYRRHHLFFDFLLRALHSHASWSLLDGDSRRRHERNGLRRWYV